MTFLLRRDRRSYKTCSDLPFDLDFSVPDGLVIPQILILPRPFGGFVNAKSDSEIISDVEVHPLEDAPRPSSLDRRKFLGKVGATVGATAAVTIVSGAASSPAAAQNLAKCDDVIFPMGHEPTYFAKNRFMKSFKCRQEAAKMARERTLVTQINNGDDLLYGNKSGSYSKALPHNNLGEVDPAAYQTLVDARESNDPGNWDKVTLGLGRKLTSPQAGLAMDLQGPDSHHIKLPPAPAFASAEEAGEEVELYWMALARDVNFSDYATSPIIAKACEDLSKLSDFRGPKQGGQVTPDTIFRASFEGDLVGPWISQFLLIDFPFGANRVSRKMQTALPGVDYLTRYEDWLLVQNGADPSANIQYDPTHRYMRNIRDIGEWVHVDALYQAYLHACLIMFAQGTKLDPGLPLYNSEVQAGFAQCGGPHILSLVCEVATRALKAVWYQKWFVQHRLRPEEYGGRVHNHLSGSGKVSASSRCLELLGNPRKSSQRIRTYLLPIAFPEGLPTHPSYGGGHATVAGGA